MSDRLFTSGPQTCARTTGALYLVIIVCGLFSEVFVRSRLVVADSAVETARNILASEGLFRVGFLADTVMAMSDVALAVFLFVLLRPVSPTLSMLAMVFRLMQAAILGSVLLEYYSALLLLGDADGFRALGEGERAALSLFLLVRHGHGYDLALLFFGASSVVVGYLVVRADYLPKVLGLLIVASGVVYLVGGVLLFMAPGAAVVFAPAYLVPVLGETAFCLWLLVKGVDVARFMRQQDDLPA